MSRISSLRGFVQRSSMVRAMLVGLVLASTAVAAERADRAEIFDSLNGEGAASATAQPKAPEIKHEVTITGKLTPGLQLDLELQYKSTNKFRDVLVGGVGWVKEPLPKMLRPGVTYREDGTYEIKFSTFTSSVLAGKFQMHYARIGILKRGVAPTYFDLRADRPAAPAMSDLQRITVIQLDGAHGATLSADPVTSSGSAPHRVIQLPTESGATSFNLDVTLE